MKNRFENLLTKMNTWIFWSDATGTLINVYLRLCFAYEKNTGTIRGAFHKAGFTCHKKQKEYGRFSYSFYMPRIARYNVLHLIDALSGGNEPRWHGLP